MYSNVQNSQDVEELWKIISERLGFVPTAHAPPEIQQTVQTALASEQYLQFALFGIKTQCELVCEETGGVVVGGGGRTCALC